MNRSHYSIFALITAYAGILLIIFGLAFLLKLYLPLFIGLMVGGCYMMYVLFIHKNENKFSVIMEKKYSGYLVLFCLIFFPVIGTIIIAGCYLHQTINQEILCILFAEGILFGAIPTLFSIPFILKNELFYKSDQITYSLPPLITIIVPAYNEELNIKWTIESVKQTTYPNKQIIIVDDGSNDNTHVEAQKALQNYPSERCLVLKKPNGGKASALDFGLEYAKGEIIVTIDSDSIVNRNAFDEMVNLLQNPDVSAIAGNPRVLNRVNIMTNCQQLEYSVGNLFKRLQSILGTVMVIPGVLGAFKNDKLIERGKYTSDTLAEDFDATIKILKSRKTILLSSDSIVYTQAPSDLKNLYKQRIRWDRGTLQTFVKHKNILSYSRYGLLSSFSYPILLLLFVAAPLFDILLIALVIILSFTSLSWNIIPLLVSGFFAIPVLIALISLVLDKVDWKIAIYAPLMIFGYRQLLATIRIKSILDVLVIKKNFCWTSVKRTKHLGGTT